MIFHGWVDANGVIFSLACLQMHIRYLVSVSPQNFGFQFLWLFFPCLFPANSFILFSLSSPESQSSIRWSGILISRLIGEVARIITYNCMCQLIFIPAWLGLKLLASDSRLYCTILYWPVHFFFIFIGLHRYACWWMALIFPFCIFFKQLVTPYSSIDRHLKWTFSLLIIQKVKK